MPNTESTVEVMTAEGAVIGRRMTDALVFLGIPYAAAPVGRGRFDPPQPHAAWPIARDATTPGPTAPQPKRDAFGDLDTSPCFGEGWVPGDDYLTVNVWTPATAPWNLPVMVFVHGGGFVAGSTRSALYDGTSFSRNDVVLVTVNYRLGVSGFLHLPDAPDNRGLLDVVAALQWVKQNIAGFGGDPEAVTLFGQSAGATIVGGILATKAASGLFSRAIIQSGSGRGTFTREQAGLVTARLSEVLGVPPTAEALSAVSDHHFVQAIPRLSGIDLQLDRVVDPLLGLSPFSLVFDEQPADLVAASDSLPVDLLIGTNSEEGNLYPAPLVNLATSTADARRLADVHSTAGARTFAYEFAWRSHALRGELGATHATELPFVFNTVHLPKLNGETAFLGADAPPADLAPRVHRAWIDFATTGDPGWDEYDPVRRPVMRIGEDWSVSENDREDEFAASALPILPAASP